jgi:hypothetical protein
LLGQLSVNLITVNDRCVGCQDSVLGRGIFGLHIIGILIVSLQGVQKEFCNYYLFASRAREEANQNKDQAGFKLRFMMFSTNRVAEVQLTQVTRSSPFTVLFDFMGLLCSFDTAYCSFEKSKQEQSQT